MEKKKKVDIFNSCVQIIYKYLLIPFSIIILLAWICEWNKDSLIGNIINYILAVVFVFWIVIIMYNFSKKVLRISLVWPFVISLTIFILSFVISLGGQNNISNILFYSGIFFIELFFIYVIINRAFLEKNKISEAMILALLFIVIGYLSIFSSSYGIEDKTMFNSLIAVFSAIVGGGVTLCGVAWTIRTQKEEYKSEELKRIKPYISFQMLYEKPELSPNIKSCISDEKQNYDCDSDAEINNSNLSVVKLSRIYHDGKWFNLVINNTLLPGEKIIFNFKFSSPDDIFLEVKDILENKYYYRVEVLFVDFILNGKSPMHTIRSLKEVNKEELPAFLKNIKKE